MTPILTHLHEHFPADWKQSPSIRRGNVLQFWYEAGELGAYIEIGGERLYVRWFDGNNLKGQYGGAGVDLTVTQTRAGLDEALPMAVAKAAIAHAWRGLPVPAVPEWAAQAIDTAVKKRLNVLGARRAKIDAEIVRVDAEYMALVGCCKARGATL